MKNPLKQPPIGVKKKVIEVTPHWWWKKNDLKCPPLGVKKNHLNWSPLGWSDPPLTMKRKWLELPHSTWKNSIKWLHFNGLWKNISLEGTWPIMKFYFSHKLTSLVVERKTFTWFDMSWNTLGIFIFHVANFKLSGKICHGIFCDITKVFFGINKGVLTLNMGLVNKVLKCNFMWGLQHKRK